MIFNQDLIVNTHCIYCTQYPSVLPHSPQTYTSHSYAKTPLFKGKDLMELICQNTKINVFVSHVLIKTKPFLHKNKNVCFCGRGSRTVFRREVVSANTACQITNDHILLKYPTHTTHRFSIGVDQ